MKINQTGRHIEYLASVLALVSGYYAIRAALLLPKFQLMLAGIGEGNRELDLGRSILNHPDWFLALVIATLAINLFAIWKTFNGHVAVYSIGIAFEFFLLERAFASVMDPMVRMINVMSSQ